MLDNIFSEALHDIEQKNQLEDIKKYTQSLHDVYEAYKGAGFTDAQSLELVKQFMLCSVLQQNGGKKNA